MLALRSFVRFLFPVAMTVLVISNVYEFRVQQAAVPDPYRPLRSRLGGPLSAARAPLAFRPYYMLQEALGGSELAVPDVLQLESWAWQNLALVDLVPGAAHAVRPAAAGALRRRTRYTIDLGPVRSPSPGFLRVQFLRTPDELRGERVLLLPVAGNVARGAKREVFLALPADTADLEPFLE